MKIDLNVEEENHKAIENILEAYYGGFINMNNPKYNNTKKTVEEDRVTLRDIIDFYRYK